MDRHSHETGTGKSFIGARITKYIHDLSNHRILVISFTNHALDQFLEDLMDVGIPEEKMVRLGSKAKCTERTAPLLLSEQKNNKYHRSHEVWSIIDDLNAEAASVSGHLTEVFDAYRRHAVSPADIQEYLEFESDCEIFYQAFHIPVALEDWKIAKGKKQQAIGPGYLLERWVQGEGPGALQNQVSEKSKPIWEMPISTRREHYENWSQALLGEKITEIQQLVHLYDDTQSSLETLLRDKHVSALQQKRVIGCTTTGAAKYTKLIQQAKPDVVLVEEAGEILESHILTSLAPTVRQLILIGDHKQLRPKVNNYTLTVERGEGFDLNRSLFERMILQGSPFTTLQKQHRMVPEISLFPRMLTYPDLLDGPKTQGRPTIRGLRDRVIFWNHDRLEEDETSLADRRDAGATSSKSNKFEVQLVLKCIKYLSQQGYGTKNMVVLTPYLGQLRQLRNQLVDDSEHDPVLGDIDYAELIRAGVLTAAAAKVSKKPLRISTIGEPLHYHT
jgi:hypothetical protein